MADYKRMVSYMYQYEDGIKRKNVGFARVEAKSGQCKITLHMQLLGQLDSIFPTYLIQRDDKNINLIYLGDTLLKNQVMDSKLTADENNIMNSGHSLSDMGGLLIFYNDKIFFATEWDDKPIVAMDVLEALKPKETPTVSSVEEEGDTSRFQEEEKAVIDKNALEVSAEEANIPKYKLLRGWKSVENPRKPPAAEAGFFPGFLGETQNIDNRKETETYEIVSKETDQNQSIRQEQLEYQRQQAQQEQQENPYEQSQQENQNEQSQQEQHTMADQQGMSGEHRVPEQSGRTAAASMNAGPEEDPPTAKHFFDSYPRIYPFEDNEITLCVKIEPKDIGFLPKDVWSFSNNSFLMHGFYCYHHLIFAKIKDRFGCRYILGIPGIYHNREQFMARMFGFDSFKSIRKRELRQGDFGYWYIPVYF